ncbi:recombination mediator RecR [Nitratiruptor sp. SB155-2]|uniref:Recombination protein RecR n=1 Tax=Nitratiruptor sp. (strain SB155-2) TaxID=387092 RepID=RECR_NITSB|nr:recombination mediator RecR [Nitratiruptor sp. SB155-2]A6Q485.1 RecName: Full=Recombination protein RecR [Nitratiruptor sp. SB155-2]BAF70294.1 DNA recombination protein RecR [Nitratiruptor sp. SB155-2]
MKGKLKKFYNLVEALETLPSIGKKSAGRLAFHMVLHSPMDALKLAHAIEDAVSSIHRCTQCGGLSEDELCYICSDELRDRSSLCLVESARDIYVIEESGEYHGLYFVFESLNERILANLKEMIKNNGVQEIIFAFTPSMQSDATMLYIEDQLQEFHLHFTKIAQGVPTGVHLENVDMLSLSKAISERVKI